MDIFSFVLGITAVLFVLFLIFAVVGVIKINDLKNDINGLDKQVSETAQYIDREFENCRREIADVEDVLLRECNDIRDTMESEIQDIRNIVSNLER